MQSLIIQDIQKIVSVTSKYEQFVILSKTSLTQDFSRIRVGVVYVFICSTKLHSRIAYLSYSISFKTLPV